MTRRAIVPILVLAIIVGVLVVGAVAAHHAGLINGIGGVGLAASSTSIGSSGSTGSQSQSTSTTAVRRPVGNGWVGGSACGCGGPGVPMYGSACIGFKYSAYIEQGSSVEVDLWIISVSGYSGPGSVKIIEHYPEDGKLITEKSITSVEKGVTTTLSFQPDSSSLISEYYVVLSGDYPAPHTLARVKITVQVVQP